MRWILFLLPIFLLANPSLDEVLDYPHTYYRDFWLTEYLKKSKNVQAENIYNEITYKKKYHLKLLANRYAPYKVIYDCKYVTKKNWIDVDSECIVQNGFRLRDLKKMGDEEIKSLLNYIPDSKTKTEIEIIFNKKYKKAFKGKDIFYDIFLKYTPDIEIPDIYINNIVNDKRFRYLLHKVVRSKKNNIKSSLLNIDYKMVNDRYKFDLALNAISLNRDNLAIKILKSKKYKKNRDKFWLYLLTKNRKYANELLDNKRLDFYTLWIYEKFNKNYKLDQVKIFNQVDPKYNIDNPLDVIKFYKDKSKTKDYFKFAKELDNQKELPLKALILDKAFRYTKNYYIMPKYNLSDLNISQKALFYALARQESRFIPAQTSRSYAIGLMQMMPFLIKSFHPKEDIESFFTAKVNVKYAKKHMNWLIKRLNNPLFVSYAYNGGIGFTKRKVMNYFKFKGEYEPFFSMEMVPYTESREYGKKVLTNYVIYKTLLGEKTTLHEVLKQVKKEEED
jgi:soluble lytic murein transglycosylase